jgi:hypothetical protein
LDMLCVSADYMRRCSEYSKSIEAWEVGRKPESQVSVLAGMGNPEVEATFHGDFIQVVND